jgi:hypothetical protein
MPMPLPVSVESLDAIPEAARAAYVEREGAFVLDVELEDTSGLKSALHKERDEKKSLARTVKELQSQMNAIETEKAAIAAGLTSERLQEIRSQLETEYAPIKAAYEELSRENRVLKLDSRVKNMLAPHVVNLEKAWKLMADEFDLTDDGKPFAKRNPAADLEHVITTELRKEYDFIYRGTAAAGGGASGAGSPGAAAREKGRPPSEWTPAEKMEYAQTHGRDALFRLSESQGKKNADALVAAMQQPPRAA